MKQLLGIALVMALAGCASMAPVKPTLPYDGEAARLAMQPGEATLTGQAFLRTVGGEVRYGAGSPVILIPAIPFVRECDALARAHPFRGVDCIAGSSIRAHSKQTTADGEGRFKFENLRPGEYLVVTTVTWFVGYAQQGGEIRMFVTLPEGAKTKEVIITQ